MTLRIMTVDPAQGWPGTIVDIRGEGFDPHRDNNAVIVGNRPALVLRAEKDRLLVMAAEDARDGKILVTVGADIAEGPDFALLPWPEDHDWMATQPPRFFHGPQRGTPSRNVQDQRVLVLPVHTIESPPVPSPTAADLAALDVKYGRVSDYWASSTFQRTTWKFQRHASWLQLPRGQDFYIIGQRHIDAARLDYLTSDRRIVGDSGVLFAASGVGTIPILHPSPTSWSFLLGPNGPNDGNVLAQLKVGNTLYIGTYGGTFAIYDVSNPGSAALVGRVDAGDPVWDIALIGTDAVIAQGPGGLGLVDISNPATPSMSIGGAGIGANREWATRVKVLDNRIYSNRGQRLRVQTIGPFSTFFTVANVDVGDWITDIAVDGNRCIVGTDGSGIITYEITAGGVLEKGRINDFAFPREIRIAGNIAWVAASEDGLAAIDIGNLAGPAALGSKKFKKDANSLVLNGNEAVVALGYVVLASVNIANPATMTLAAPEQTPGSRNVPMADRRAFLISRINDRRGAVDFDRIFIDALRCWFAATGNNHTHLDPYEGIVVSFHGTDVRAHSGPADKLASWEFAIPFNGTKGLFYEQDTDSWTVPTHEIVHWLGMDDLYQERFADGSIVIGTAGQWCISGSDGDAPLFCAQRLTDALDCLKIGTGPAENVRQLVWGPTTQIDQTFDVVAHGASEDGDSNRVHGLRLVVSSAMTYWVEVRQHAPAGLLFDQAIPVVPAGAPGCVLVTRATDEQSVVDNTFERPVQLMGVLQPGGTVVDASRNLVITVDSQIQADPLAYRVRIQWNQPIPENPDGAFDLTITPWDLKTYETPDIWIDSSRNLPNVYEFNDGDPAKPVLNGDRPWVKHDNKIKARIRNTGPLQVDDIHVTCYVTSPPGIGDNGEWQTLATVPVASIAGNSDTVVEFDWVPEVDKHTCISIAVLPKLGEVTGKNNRAQENVAVFDSASGSSHEPVILEAEVRSPFTIGKRVDVLVRHLPDRWHAVVDRAYVWLGGKGSAPVRAVIWTDLQSSGLEGERGERLAKPTIEGWTFDGHYYRPIGGILAPIRAVPGVTIEWMLEHGGGAVYVWGHLEPRARQVPIAVEIRAESGRTWMLYGATDNNGEFSPSTGEAGFALDPGRYTVQVFTGGGPNAAETESEIREIVLNS